MWWELDGKCSNERNYQKILYKYEFIADAWKKSCFFTLKSMQAEYNNYYIISSTCTYVGSFGINATIMKLLTFFFVGQERVPGKLNFTFGRQHNCRGAHKKMLGNSCSFNEE